MTRYDALHGGCIEVMQEMDESSVSAIVCDPPYGLSKEPDIADVLQHWLAGDDYVHRGGGFMGKSWDSFVPGPAYWRACYRVLKPGGYLLAFSGTRTVDLLGIAIRLAGFERRDIIAWLYGSGFPKSLNVSKSIDKAAGVNREQVPATGGLHANVNLNDDGWSKIGMEEPMMDGNKPVTAEAEQWDGWGTAMKPAFEPIICARKPLIGTVVKNVLEHGTGAINVDGCRIDSGGDKLGGGAENNEQSDKPEGWDRPWRNDPEAQAAHAERIRENVQKAESLGRWPANVVLGHSDGCEQVGVQQISGDQRDTGGGTRPSGFGDVGAGSGDSEPNAAVYGDEEVGVWRCVEGCPVGALDQQVGDRTSGSRVQGVRTGMGFHGANGDGGPAVEGSSGGPSRFFFTVPRRTMEECELASSVETTSSLGAPRADSAHARAVSEGDHEAKPSSDTTEPTTSETLSRSRLSGESDMPLIPSSDSESSHGSERARPIPTGNRASDAGQNELTDTTMITPSPSSSGGFVEDVTSRSTLNSTDLGAKDSQLPIDSGDELRFKYCAKAAKKERNDGLQHLEEAERNKHSTVKPVELMRWLVRMVGPPGGLVLDPFAGSFSTGVACIEEGIDFVGIEQDAAYVEIGKQRMARRAARKFLNIDL